jgi:hypothetical protein
MFLMKQMIFDGNHTDFRALILADVFDEADFGVWWAGKSPLEF